VGDRSRTGAAHAFTDGIARVAAAPTVLAGTIAIVSFYGGSADVRHAIGAVLIWAFLSGGVLDRYARRRATRARGFFGACGAHLGAMLRLALVNALLLGAFHLAIGGDFPNGYVHEAAFVIALFLTLVLSFAQVRIAVEDRRSALGALLGGARFVFRNPASIVLFSVFVLAAMGVLLASERLVPASNYWVIAEGAIVLECFLALAWLATAVSLFQARLAHDGYTAAPPMTWPESPAAEAIANASPAVTP